MDSGKKHTVLLAAESVRALEELQALVPWEELGWTVAGREADGIRAIKQAARIQPDLLVLDVHLPGCSGIEVLRRVRSFCPQAQAILISSYAEFTYAQLALRYGAADYLVRPVERGELLHSLRRLALARPMGAAAEDLWQRRLEAAPELADGRRKVAVCAHSGLELEEPGGLLLLRQEPSRLWAAAVSEEEEPAWLERLAARRVRVGISAPFFSCREAAAAIRQAELAASPFWGGRKGIVREERGGNYEAARTLGQLWGLLRQCGQGQYSWDQFWAMYDVLFTVLQRLTADFRQTLAVYNSLVLMARSIHPQAGLSLPYRWEDSLLEPTGGETLEGSLLAIRRSLQISLQDGCFNPDSRPFGPLTDEILSYIGSHFCDPDISVESVAARFYISPAYFGQTFKRDYGISITEHINRKRMDYAEYLLTHEDLSVKEVSCRVGIPYQYYFSKLFKKYKGTTPGAARRAGPRESEENL